MAVTPSLRIAVAFAALSLAGCGTLANFGIQPCPKNPALEVYGGVQQDFAYMGPDATGRIEPGYIVLGLVDLPLSLVADTATLPITAIATASEARLRRERALREPPKHKQAP